MISLIPILNISNDFVISYKPENFHKKDFLMLICYKLLTVCQNLTSLCSDKFNSMSDRRSSIDLN